jgi:type I restriction enzyme S subunit
MTPPASWQRHKLGDLARYINGKAFKPQDWKPTGLPIIRIQNLTSREKPFNYCDQSIEDRYLVRDGDLLISWSATLGSFIWDRGPAALNQHIFKAIPKEDLIERDFLHYLLLVTLDEMSEHAHGIAMKHITKGKFEAIEVALPPLLEQRRIVARIKACMERVEEIEDLRDQSIREAINIELACFHDSLMEGMERKRWPVMTLGDVSKSFRYGTSAKAHSQGEGLPVIRMGNLQGGYLDLSDLKYIEMSATEAARYKLNVGDVLINRTNSLELVGKAATFGVEEGVWLYASYLVRVEVDRERVIPEFVSSVINSALGRGYVLRTARRAIGMVNLNAKEMAKFPIPVPSLNEQEQVVARLMDARRLAEGLRASITGSEVGFLRDAVLQKAFTGEL